MKDEYRSKQLIRTNITHVSQRTTRTYNPERRAYPNSAFCLLSWLHAPYWWSTPTDQGNNSVSVNYICYNLFHEHQTRTEEDGSEHHFAVLLNCCMPPMLMPQPTSPRFSTHCYTTSLTTHYHPNLAGWIILFMTLAHYVTFCEWKTTSFWLCIAVSLQAWPSLSCWCLLHYDEV